MRTTAFSFQAHFQKPRVLRRRRTINAGLTRFAKRESPIFTAEGTEIETVTGVAGGGIERPTQGFSVLCRVALPRSALFGFVLASAAEYPIFCTKFIDALRAKWNYPERKKPDRIRTVESLCPVFFVLDSSTSL